MLLTARNCYIYKYRLGFVHRVSPHMLKALPHDIIWAMENRKGPLGELGQNLINCIFVVIEHVTCYCNALCIGTSMFH